MSRQNRTSKVAATSKSSRKEKPYEEHYREMYGTIWTQDEIEAFRRDVTTSRKNADKVRQRLALY